MQGSKEHISEMHLCYIGVHFCTLFKSEHKLF